MLCVCIDTLGVTKRAVARLVAPPQLCFRGVVSAAPQRRADLMELIGRAQVRIAGTYRPPKGT